MTDLEMIGQAYVEWYQCNDKIHIVYEELKSHMEDPSPTITDYTDESFKNTLSSLSEKMLNCLHEATQAYDELNGLMLNYLTKQTS
ncbi:hypothetical protein [Moraxella catarrhalis]|uniref:hypothetical protein n=1 Tax=Moraxella catarrhalis TaxID=480 RepID=UPI000EAA0422|nr:hypothetical protein [Moraxella catarrhalis]RKM32211.1 hypothetical protein D6D86_04180 [Moraxella catarrhalis]